MEEKILMRIHDDENDCDLVSVKNPLGHFGMSIFAEKNGARKPVDGMHMLSKMIEQVGNGGWPADLPKPSVGGYGYTEQGKQTVLFDGIARTEMDRSVAFGEIDKFEIVVGQTYSVAFNNEIFGGVIAHLGNKGYVVLGDEELSEYPFRIDYHVNNDTNLLSTQNGGNFQLKVVGGTPDTIHKIDEKYLPQSGGTMMVNITSDENGNHVADKTYDEIRYAISTGVVVKCVIYNENARRNFVCDLHSYDI